MGTKFILGQEDGTIAGGDPRGANAVDLQTSRTVATQVSSGEFSSILGGLNNRNLAPVSFIGGGNTNFINGSVGSSYQNKVIVGGSDNQISNVATRNTFIGGGYGNNINGASEAGSILGGYQNTLSGSQTVISGGQGNTVSSNHSTVSGGQSNTASTNTHATVVGGSSNTSSGQYSISGGQSNTASGSGSIALGTNNIVTNSSVKIGFSNTGSNASAFAFGFSNSNTGTEDTYNFGLGNSCSHFTTMAMGFYNSVGRNNSIAIGTSNTVSGSSFSTILGGQSNLASGGIEDKYITIVGGLQCLGYQWGSVNSASGRFSTTGDAQQSSLTARKSATLTTGGTTTLSLDGTGTTNLIIPNGTNRMWKVKVEYVGTITTITGTATGLTVGDTVYGEENFGFKKLSGTSTMGPIMNETQSSDNAIMDTCSLAVTAGASQQMALTFTGPTFAGGGSVTMRIVAKVALVEVAF